MGATKVYAAVNSPAQFEMAFPHTDCRHSCLTNAVCSLYLAHAVLEIIFVVTNEAVYAVHDYPLKCPFSRPRDIRLERPGTRVLRRYRIRMVRPNCVHRSVVSLPYQ